MPPSELETLAPRRGWSVLIDLSRRRGRQLRRRRRAIRGLSAAALVPLLAVVVFVHGSPTRERVNTDKPSNPPAFVPAPNDGAGTSPFSVGGVGPGRSGSKAGSSARQAPAGTHIAGPIAGMAAPVPRVPGLGPRDRVAFTTNDDGDFAQIAVVNGDGTGRAVVSHDLPFNDSDPAWSPDGRRIAFVSDRDNPERRAHISNEVYVMNADGSGERRLTHAIPGGNGNADPAWSPDGTWIAFDGDDAQGHGDIWIVHPDGTGLRNLTNSFGIEDFWPSWSPDGARLAFVSERTGIAQVWVMSADGSGAHAVTYQSAPSQRPSWSPDGRHIAFDRVGGDGFRHVWVMNADGSDQRLLVPGPGESSWPSWSPDGSEVVLAQDPDGFMDAYDALNYGTMHGGPAPGSLAVVNLDGSGLRPLTHPGAATNDYAPAPRPR